MGTMTTYHFLSALYRWRGNGVLKAILLYAAVVGVVAVMTAFAVWQARCMVPPL